MKSSFEHLERYRAKHPALPSSKQGDRHGFFFIQRGRDAIRIVMDDGQDPAADDAEIGWEHVSVSIATHRGLRTPSWEEMCYVKELFWDDDECVVQFHPPRSEYVNFHPYCLHLWRNSMQSFPHPPSILVGPKPLSLQPGEITKTNR